VKDVRAVGILESHVYAHYVIFNAGKKVCKLKVKLDMYISWGWIGEFSARCIGIESAILARGYAVEIRNMYSLWSQSPRFEYWEQILWQLA